MRIGDPNSSAARSCRVYGICCSSDFGASCAAAPGTDLGIKEDTHPLEVAVWAPPFGECCAGRSAAAELWLDTIHTARRLRLLPGVLQQCRWQGSPGCVCQTVLWPRLSGVHHPPPSCRRGMLHCVCVQRRATRCILGATGWATVFGAMGGCWEAQGVAPPGGGESKKEEPADWL